MDAGGSTTPTVAGGLLLNLTAAQAIVASNSNFGATPTITGAGLALLLAPGSGSETRRKVGEAARKLGSAANEAMSHVREGDFGGRESEGFRSGGRREPMPGARTPQPGTSGTSS